MQNLKAQLQKKLKGVQRLGVLGVGSEFKADDIVGMLVAEALGGALGKKVPLGRLRAFFGCTTPENVTGQIKEFQPTHLVIIDAVQMNKKPGSCALFDVTDEREGASFSTHRMPFKILADYLCNFFPCCVIILGIQPKILAFGATPSKEIRAAARKVSHIIKEIAAAG